MECGSIPRRQGGNVSPQQVGGRQGGCTKRNQSIIKIGGVHSDGIFESPDPKKEGYPQHESGIQPQPYLYHPPCCYFVVMFSWVVFFKEASGMLSSFVVGNAACEENH